MKHDKWTNAAIRENVKAALNKYADEEDRESPVFGWKFTAVSLAMKCDRNASYDYLNGSRMPTLPMLCRFSEASGIPLDEIVMGRKR